MLANSTLSPFAFATEIRIRDIIEMYNAAERPQDLDEIIVKVPSVVAVSRALADRDGRANEFGRFLDSCAKPSDLARRPSPPTPSPIGMGEGLVERPFPVVPWGEPTPARASRPLPEGKGEEDRYVYRFVNDWGVACDLAARWVTEGYRWIFVQSDKSISRPCAEGASSFEFDGRRVDLRNKRLAGEAIVTAMRRGFRIAELCEPVRVCPQPHGYNAEDDPETWIEEPVAAVEIERIPVESSRECPICHDPDSWCDCNDIRAIGGRVAA